MPYVHKPQGLVFGYGPYRILIGMHLLESQSSVEHGRGVSGCRVVGRAALVLALLACRDAHRLQARPSHTQVESARRRAVKARMFAE